jgi:hypothetical protein
VSEDSNWKWAISEAYKRCGPPPLIGTFDPQLGDIGVDVEGNFYFWDGSRFLGRTTQSKPFEEFLGFDPS